MPVRGPALRLLVAVAALAAAYVVGRAAGIVLGIGPYPTEAAALAAVLVVIVRRMT